MRMRITDHRGGGSGQVRAALFQLFLFFIGFFQQQKVVKNTKNCVSYTQLQSFTQGNNVQELHHDCAALNCGKRSKNAAPACNPL